MLASKPACSLYVLREAHSCLLEERDSIVVEVRKAYFSDITLAGITDGSGTTWPIMESKAALVCRKKVPPEQRQRSVRQFVHGGTAYGRILSGLTGRVGCEPTQGLCDFVCLNHSDYRGHDSAQEQPFTQAISATLSATRSASSKL